jgi:Fe2+ or Zn2+ uptake regulation protein
MPKKSLFIELFGDSPTIRVLDFLLTERELDFSISDIARNSGIGRATLYRIWEQLIENNIITHTRTIGKSKLYKLNIQNPKIKKLIEIDDMLILEELRDKSEKQRQKIKVTI